MTRTALIGAALVAACLVPALPALASSSASSVSLEGSSASIGSLSTSLEGSSNSSSGERRTAAGDYRITELASAEQRPGQLRLTLQAVPGSGAEGELQLWLPLATVQQHELAAGTVVSVAERPYGLQFALAQRPFFLAVQDEWLREMRTTPVAL